MARSLRQPHSWDIERQLNSMGSGESILGPGDTCREISCTISGLCTATVGARMSPHSPRWDSVVGAAGENDPPTPSHRALARWLVTTEIEADAEGALAAPEAAERVFGKLGKRLAQLITDVGADALVARAVHLSLAAFPFLGGAQIRRSGDSLILNLGESADGTESSQVAEGFEAVLATLVALLVSFIGEDLTARVLRDVWPELAMLQAVQPSQNDPTNLEVNP